MEAITPENSFLDLSKLSEEQRKQIAKLILIKSGLSMSDYLDLLHGKIDEPNGFYLLEYAREQWHLSFDVQKHKTEITYPEFIKLFEGGEGENETSLQIAIKALENIIDPIGHMKSQLEEGDTLNGGYAIILSEKPQFYQDIAKEALRKINSNQ